MKWYLKAFKNYAGFEGRARRKEFWYFNLFCMGGFLLLGGLDSVIGTYDFDSGVGVLSGLYSLAHLMPGVAVTARRYHDIGKSGLWMLILLVPIIGPILFLMDMVCPSSEGENRYGPDPTLASSWQGDALPERSPTSGMHAQNRL